MGAETDHDDYDYGNPVECWQCGGEGFVSSCFQEFACMHTDEGCDDCTRRCDICQGEGGWSNDIPGASHVA